MEVDGCVIPACDKCVYKGDDEMRCDTCMSGDGAYFTRLKPCPFCGKGVATVTTCANVEDCDNFETCEDTGFHCVVCDVNKGGCGASGGYRQSYDDAVKAWNRRSDNGKSNISG